MTTETRTYIGESGTAAFDGYAGFRIGKNYTATTQEDGTVRVTAQDALPGNGITLKKEEWARWFRK
jgi:hypothetical protein